MPQESQISLDTETREEMETLAKCGFSRDKIAEFLQKKYDQPVSADYAEEEIIEPLREEIFVNLPSSDFGSRAQAAADHYHLAGNTYVDRKIDEHLFADIWEGVNESAEWQAKYQPYLNLLRHVYDLELPETASETRVAMEDILPILGRGLAGCGSKEEVINNATESLLSGRWHHCLQNCPPTLKDRIDSALEQLPWEEKKVLDVLYLTTHHGLPKTEARYLKLEDEEDISAKEVKEREQKAVRDLKEFTDHTLDEKCLRESYQEILDQKPEPYGWRDSIDINAKKNWQKFLEELHKRQFPSLLDLEELVTPPEIPELNKEFWPAPPKRKN